MRKIDKSHLNKAAAAIIFCSDFCGELGGFSSRFRAPRAEKQIGGATAEVVDKPDGLTARSATCSVAGVADLDAVHTLELAQTA
jgi:hypothetical protein